MDVMHTYGWRIERRLYNMVTMVQSIGKHQVLQAYLCLYYSIQVVHTTALTKSRLCMPCTVTARQCFCSQLQTHSVICLHRL